MKPSIPGLVLVVIGVLFLLRNLGWDLHLGHLFAVWWPVLLIAAGVSMFFKRWPRA